MGGLKETVKLFWVSGIVQNESDKKPWLLAMSEGELTMDKAKESINFMKENYNVLSVWIDTFDENNVKETVFHECFIDAFGHTVQS